MIHPRFEPGPSGAELINDKKIVSPRTSEFFIISNNNYIWGSMSWELEMPQMDEKVHRLVLTYEVPWNPGCSGARGNNYRIFFDDEKLVHKDGKKV